MAKWDLQPAQIGRTLRNTADAAGELEGEVTAYGDHVESATWSAGTIHSGGGGVLSPGVVAAALVEFSARVQDDMLFVAARAGRSIEGARKEVAPNPANGSFNHWQTRL